MTIAITDRLLNLVHELDDGRSFISAYRIRALPPADAAALKEILTSCPEWMPTSDGWIFTPSKRK